MENKEQYINLFTPVSEGLPEKINGYKHSKNVMFVKKNPAGEISIDYGSSAILESVHQLQNLYFALTGEELSILID